MSYILKVCKILNASLVQNTKLKCINEFHSLPLFLIVGFPYLPRSAHLSQLTVSRLNSWHPAMVKSTFQTNCIEVCNPIYITYVETSHIFNRACFDAHLLYRILTATVEWKIIDSLISFSFLCFFSLYTAVYCTTLSTGICNKIYENVYSLRSCSTVSQTVSNWLLCIRFPCGTINDRTIEFFEKSIVNENGIHITVYIQYTCTVLYTF